MQETVQHKSKQRVNTCENKVHVGWRAPCAAALGKTLFRMLSTVCSLSLHASSLTLYLLAVHYIVHLLCTYFAQSDLNI